MIISHLTKIYKERKNEVIAVNDVSFNLPKSGLIFILGKSGSGKTTLLNCLGGIDEETSGDVIIGNKHFSSFTDRDYDDYRNNYLGFIFQDFYLMDKLTAFENVRVSLDSKGINDDKRVDDLDGNDLYYANSCFYSFQPTNDDIKDDEIYLTPLFYNMLFGTNITSAKSEEYIDKQKINIIFYEPGKDNISYEKTFAIVGIVNGDYGKVNSNASKEMQREKIFYTYSLYFDNYSDVYNVYELSGGEDSLYYFESNDFNIINNLAKAVTIFSDFFVLIEVALCVIVVLTICSFSFSSVRKSREDIGILRSLGTRSVSVASIFVFQILLIGILISLISSVLLCTILPVANKLIVGNFSNFSTSVVTSYLTVLKYYPSVLIINILVTISATVLSSFAPFIAVSHVKPIEIIKSKE